MALRRAADEAGAMNSTTKSIPLRGGSVDLAARKFSKARSIAERLGICPRTIFRWADAGKIARHNLGSFEIVGFFAVAPTFEGDPDRLVQISGTSLLYCAVREMVCNLTARGPWPMLCLPTLNFTAQPGESPVPLQNGTRPQENEAPQT